MASPPSYWTSDDEKDREDWGGGAPFSLGDRSSVPYKGLTLSRGWRGSALEPAAREAAEKILEEVVEWSNRQHGIIA